MAFRANVNRNKKSSLAIKIAKYLLIFVISIGILVGGLVLFFNGQNVKAPLLKFLSDRTSLTINCDNIEFSAIYPNVIKLKGVTLNKSHVDEIYMEYDLPSLLKSDTLDFKYFYAKGIKLNNEDLDKLKQEKFGFKDVNIEKLDLIDAPLATEHLKSKNASFSAVHATLNTDGKLEFKNGELKVKQGSFDDYDIKELSTNLEMEDDNLKLSNLSLQILGGTIYGDLTFNQKTSQMNFSSLALNKLIFTDYKDLLNNYNIFIPHAEISNCVFAMSSQDVFLGQVKGSLDNVLINKDKFEFEFVGKAGEISKPSLQLTADDSIVKAYAHNHQIDFKAQGNTLNGMYLFDGSFKAQNEQNADHEIPLTIHRLYFKDGKIEFSPYHLGYLKKNIIDKNIAIEKLQIENTEFVSFINEFPVSIKSIYLKANNLHFNQGLSNLDEEVANIDFNFDSGYYSDLFVKSFESKSILDKDGFIVKVPSVQFQKSKLTAAFGHEYTDDKYSFKLNAKNFDISDLNSNLTEHLFNGKLDLEINLKTKDYVEPKELTDNAQTLKQQANNKTVENYEEEYIAVDKNGNVKAQDIEEVVKEKNLSPISQRLLGTIKVTGDNLLVSHLGLDLLNGGPRTDYIIKDSRKFLNSIEDGDVGFYKLKIDGNIENGALTGKGSSDLITSHITTRFNYKLDKKELNVRSTLVSLAKDSITRFVIRGPLDKLMFITSAITRGEMRPGLNEDALKDVPPKELSDKNVIPRDETSTDTQENSELLKVNPNLQDETIKKAIDIVKDKAEVIEKKEEKEVNPKENLENSTSKSSQN